MTQFCSGAALQSAMRHDDDDGDVVQRRSWRRIGEFARPHRRTIIAFLVFATISAGLGVLAPVLAGRAVDAIVSGDSTSTVIGIAVLIAAVAVLDAAVGMLERWQSSRLGEGLILDLRRRVFEHGRGPVPWSAG